MMKKKDRIDKIFMILTRGLVTVGIIAILAMNVNAQTLTLDWPNGGQSWEADTPRPIHWHSPDSWTGNVKLELSTDGGVTYPHLIVASHPSTSSPYTWTVNDMPSTQCRIKISNAAGGDPTDESDANFTITSNPTITVDVPDVGESWEAEEPHDIVWHSHIFTGNVDIELSTDGGGTYPHTIATNIPTPVSQTATSYTWTVPNTPSTQCRVKISDAATGTPSDISDVDFTITSNPTITVDVPNDGESWEAEEPHDIVWHSHIFTGNVDIELSTDGGGTYPHTIATNIPTPVSQTATSYTWTVSNTPSTQCRIKISNAAGGGPTDESDANFTITSNPTITIDDPNGGESLRAGWQYPIVWHSHIFTGNVDIEFSTDGGGTYPHTIATNIPTPVSQTATSYTWTVSNTPSTTCRIKISDAATGTPFDMSDNDFTIADNARPLPSQTPMGTLILIGLLSILSVIAIRKKQQ